MFTSSQDGGRDYYHIHTPLAVTRSITGKISVAFGCAVQYRQLFKVDETWNPYVKIRSIGCGVQKWEDALTMERKQGVSAIFLDDLGEAVAFHETGGRNPVYLHKVSDTWKEDATIPSILANAVTFGSGYLYEATRLFAMSRNGRHIVFVEGDLTLKIWDRESTSDIQIDLAQFGIHKQCRRRINRRNRYFENFKDVDVSYNGDKITILSACGTMDSEGDFSIHTFQLVEGKWMHSVAFTGDFGFDYKTGIVKASQNLKAFTILKPDNFASLIHIAKDGDEVNKLRSPEINCEYKNSPSTGEPTNEPTNVPTKDMSIPDENCERGFVSTLAPGYCFSSKCSFVGEAVAGAGVPEIAVLLVRTKGSCDIYGAPCKMSVCANGQLRQNTKTGSHYENLGPSFCPVPTSSPTNLPTNEPTKDPTNKPTSQPTNEPTKDPTNEPTSQPTNKPTKDPTNEPTSQPTNKPTKDPTNEPTSQPTNKPTKDPTNEPTSQPTKDPTTGSPTLNPTSNRISRSPTSTPTTEILFTSIGVASSMSQDIFSQSRRSGPNIQTETRSVIPASTPTTDPTTNPTTDPTPMPTTNPTTNPTTAPTTSPTAVPTTNPTPVPFLGTFISKWAFEKQATRRTIQEKCNSLRTRRSCRRRRSICMWEKSNCIAKSSGTVTPISNIKGECAALSTVKKCRRKRQSCSWNRRTRTCGDKWSKRVDLCGKYMNERRCRRRGRRKCKWDSTQDVCTAMPQCPKFFSSEHAAREISLVFGILRLDA